MNRRFVSVSLSLWPTERLTRTDRRKNAAPDERGRPLALTRAASGGQCLYALDAGAQALGLQRGMSVADARALVPELLTRPASPDADRAALKALARWCGRWSPWTASDAREPGNDGVFIEITGCQRLFGGEEKLLGDMAAQFRALGLTARLAAAPSLGLAWGLARFDPDAARGPLSVGADAAPRRLAALPVEALRQPDDTNERLRALGLMKVDAVMRQPRAALARRFGLALPQRIDQARGIEGEVLDPLLPARAFRTESRFVEPLTHLDPIRAAGPELLRKLCGQLDRAGRGVRRLRLTLQRVDGRTFDVEAGTAVPSRDAAHLKHLLDERLERAEIDLGFGIEKLVLTAPKTPPVTDRQGDLERGSGETDADQLADRLVARLGEDGVRRAAARESWIPERASGWAPADRGGYAMRPALDRPLLVMDRPEPVEAVAEVPDGPPRAFIWRRLRHRIARAEGPERIAPEWWRESGGEATRDYFRVETAEGRRFWLYRDGLYYRETEAPRWFVHGAS